MIICERSGQWAAALRLAMDRATPDGAAPARSGLSARSDAIDHRLIETRSAEDCRQALAEAPYALVAVGLCSASCDEVLALVRAIRERFPAAPVVVLAAREFCGYEWLARELGAVHFVSSPRRLAEAVGLARRHWDNLPAPELGTAATVWATLPWK